MEDHEIYWGSCFSTFSSLYLVVIAGLYFLLLAAQETRTYQRMGFREYDIISLRGDGSPFSAPSHIVLKNVTFGRDGQPATLVAKSVDIALSSRQLTEPRHVDTILLENGTLNLTDQTAATVQSRSSATA